MNEERHSVFKQEEEPSTDSMDHIDYIKEIKGDDLFLIDSSGKVERNSIESMMKRYHSTPEYEEPVLGLEDSKYGKTLQSLIHSAQIRNVDYETVKLGNTEHITIGIKSKVAEKCTNIEIVIKIENFNKYASEYPVQEVLDGNPENILAINGSYYRSVENEINDLVTSGNMPFTRKTLFFRLNDYDEQKDIAIYSDDFNLSDMRQH